MMARMISRVKASVNSISERERPNSIFERERLSRYREILDPCVRQLRDRMQESLQVIACRNRS